MLPDADFIFILFDWFNQIHRVVTHNLFFIVLASFIAALIVPKLQRRTAVSGMLLGGALHLFIDSCMDNNPSNGVGIALLWPLSSEFFSPFNILTFSADAHGWNDPLKMLMTLIPNMLFEVPFYLIAAAILLKKRIFSTNSLEST